MTGAGDEADVAAELLRMRAEIAALRRQLAAAAAEEQQLPLEERLLLLTEVRTLHTRLEELHALQIPRHRWAKVFIRDLEHNPHAQYRVHLYGVVYWLVNFPLVTALFFLEPALWLKLGIFITLVYSIYANFATDYGAMSAAMAAYAGPAPEIPMSAHVEPNNGQGRSDEGADAG